MVFFFIVKYSFIGNNQVIKASILVNKTPASKQLYEANTCVRLQKRKWFAFLSHLESEEYKKS